MEPKPVRCGAPGCQHLAVYKIASPWTDGSFFELKTYGLACLNHFGPMYREAQQHRAAYNPRPDETVGEIGIYRCAKGPVVRPPLRLLGLEASCRSWDRAKAGSQKVGCA